MKKKLGKDELQKIKGLSTPNAKRRLEELIKDKNLVKEVHTFYVIYRYLEKFTADSVFLRVMDFRRGERLPLDQMYVKLRIVEEKKEKEVLDIGRYYDEECYYKVRKNWERSERPFKTVDPDDIMDMNKGLICILGLPGAGKTTLCKYFCWKTLKGKYTKQRLPIYVELRGLEEKEDPVTYALYSKLKEHFTKEEIEEAVATIKHNTELFSPLFIFDGLDEVKVEYGLVLESIKNCADSSLCVVTSRRSGLIYMQHDRTYEILPLEWEEKRGFVENYFKYIDEEEKIDSFLQVLEKKEYDSISKNPMLLSILCALASDEQDVRNLPSRKSGLYKKIVVKMNEWHRSKGGEGLSQEEIRNLEVLALKLFRRKRPRILFEKDIDENTLDRAAKVGIIYKWDESRYSFLHLTLQEYFAACSLKSLGIVEWKEIIREKKDAVVWHEIIQLFAFILNEEKEYEELEILLSVILEFPDILHLNYALAGHCLAEIDMDDVDGSDDVLMQIMHEFEKTVCKNVFIGAFVHLGNKATDLLIDLLEKTDDIELKVGTLSALGGIGDPRAINPLVDLLEKTDDNCLKVNTSDALAKMGDKASNILVDLLQRTDDTALKVSILFALAKIGDSRAIDPLIDLLEKTDDNELKRKIPYTIAKKGDSRAIDPLIDLLEKTDDNELRVNILFSLGEIGVRVADPLVNLLEKTDDNELRVNILFSLAKIGDPKAIDPLIEILETIDSALKMSISFTLARMGDKAIDILKELGQKTDDKELEGIISYILANIGNPRAIDPLIEILEKIDDKELKRKITCAIANGGARVADPLIEILEKTDDNELKGIVSFAFGGIEDPRAIDPLIDLLEKTDDSLLKMSISFTLARIGGKAIDILEEIWWKTDDKELKWIILFALAGIGDLRASDPLIEILEKIDDKELKISISYALSKIGDPRAVNPLLDFLQKTDDKHLKRDISYALRNFNPIHLYPFIENQMLQRVILNVLCHFSIKSNIRFFKDKLVLPEGDVLYIGTERQRVQSIKKLDKIMRL